MRRWGRGRQNGPLSKEPEAESNLKLWKSRKVRAAEAWQEEERVRRGDGRRHLPLPQAQRLPLCSGLGLAARMDAGILDKLRAKAEKPTPCFPGTTFFRGPGSLWSLPIPVHALQSKPGALCTEPGL